MSWLSHALGTSLPGAPTLPPAPTLQTPNLPQYPGLTPEQQALLQQQQGYLQGGQGAVSGYGSNPYLQASQGADMQALQNYQNALQGKIPPNQMLAQQKQEAWNQMIQQAGQQGIQITGKTPESAVSQSTAGNQQISDFNKTWGALEQNYNLGQQQIGLQAQGQALGQQNTQYQNTMAGYGQLGSQAQQLYQPYQQQQLGPWQVATNQAMTNTDITNQNSMNQWQQQMQQIGLNYQNQMAGYQNSMGLVGGALQLGGMAVGGALGSAAGPWGTLVGSELGSQAGKTVGGMFGAQGGQNSMGMMPPSMISQYQPQGKYSQVPSSAVNYPRGGTAPSNYYLNNGGR